jgi:hypothetical protein
VPTADFVRLTSMARSLLVAAAPAIIASIAAQNETN